MCVFDSRRFLSPSLISTSTTTCFYYYCYLTLRFLLSDLESGDNTSLVKSFTKREREILINSAFFSSTIMLFIKGGADKEADSKLRRLWGFTKSYVTHVGEAYLSFVGPLLLVAMVGVSCDIQDNEPFGLRWLYYTSLKDDRVREEKFPSYEPTSLAQRRRNEAANAVEYAATTV